MNYDLIKKQVLETVYEYFNAYFSLRDWEKTVSFFDSEISGFGTGKDEISFNLDSTLLFFKRDIEQSPNVVEYIIHESHISLPAPDIAIVEMQMTLNTIYQNIPYSINNLRYSLLAVKRESGWKIHHFHTSLPNSEQQVGESYPMDSVLRQNIILESTVARQTRELQTAVTELSQLNIQKDKFMALLAHDLKSPLAASMNLIEILREDFEDFSPEEFKDKLTKVHNSISRTFNLMQDLLTWTTSTSGLFRFQPRIITLLTAIETVIVHLTELIERKQLEIQLSVPNELTVYADYDILLTILRNLISNAIKFSPIGKSILIEAKDEPNGISIRIEDEGIGMSEEVLSKVFSFKASIAQGTGGEKGHGFGLLICKEFVERHNGTITASSQPGIGSTFTIYLPHPPK